MRKETVICKGNIVRLSTDFSTETSGQSAERKKSTVKNILLDKVIIQNEREFPNKQNLREFIVTKPALQEMLKKC